MRRRCPTCGSLFSSHSIQPDGQVRCWISHGTAWIFNVDKSTWTRLNETGQQKAVPPSLWREQLSKIFKTPEEQRSANTSLNGPGSKWDRSKKQLRARRKGQASKK